MTPNRLDRRTYNHVLDDLNAAHDALRRANRAVAAGSGSKRVERNIRQIRESVAHYEQELTHYDPITGRRKGRKIFRGRPCG